ncbi:MAG: mucoidy inhibitor MuiA family protein [Candidatus Heimdallarchaeota archaeon]|nr:mucoidy inhibitor MuiA family protein [Candidatus Heimdallarchaeota archaeon]
MSSKKDTNLDTTIDRVVVYLDGARIYRSGKAELKKGFQQVRIHGLTKNLQKDSVRVSGKGKGSLGAIDVETVYQEEVSHEALNALLQEEEKLQKELLVLTQKLEFINLQNARLKALSDKFSVEFPQWLASGEIQLTTLNEFIDFETKRNTDFLKEKQKLGDDIENLQKKLNTLQAKINEYRNLSRVEQTFDITIGVDATAAGPFVFELSYQARGVTWNATYDVDLQPEKAVLKGIAQVVNRTLEDWKNVEMEISTAVFKPIRVIEPNPFYIDIYDPYARPPPAPKASRSMKKMKAGAAAPMGVMAEKEEMMDYAPDEDLFEPVAEMKESAAGVQSFVIPGKWTIPSDGNTHPVTLTIAELKTDKEFYWAATDALGVIAQDKITNDDEVVLGGNAKVYSEGEFIGETRINRVPPRDEFKLGAREELKIAAKKKLLKRVREKAGLVKGKRAISYEYELEIKNFRKEASQITIKDAIPYSRSERIKIKDFEANVVPAEDNLGVYTWELKLKPDATTKITYKYEVEWEKDYEITPSLP